MADNYLERRMADYREGRDRPSSQARRATLACIAKATPSVCILGGEYPDAMKNIRYFRILGWKVAFTHPYISSGRRIAQETGAQHHPIDPADPPSLNHSLTLISQRWGHLDLILDFSGKEIIRPESDTPMLSVRNC